MSKVFCFATLGAVLWPLYSILILVNPLTQCQVDISPSEMQYIPINTPRNITCHIEGGVVTHWVIILRDDFEQRINILLPIVPRVPGITGSRVNGELHTFVITVNTSNTSVTGLRCEGDVEAGSSTATFSNAISLTIYGIPDPPAELHLFTTKNLLRTLWTYPIIPTVTVMFNISLIFLSPSQLEDITVCVTDTDSYTFTLEGVRSCDPFTMCITATNTVGQSDPSCVNNSLPYIPSTDSIEYSLLREGDVYLLTLTIKFQKSRCLENDNRFNVALLAANESQQLTSPAIQAGPKFIAVFKGLFRKSLYYLTILSNNSLGVGLTKPQQFCTNDVQGVTICPTMMDGVFDISCEYVSGCNYSGCSYELSSMHSYINGSIIGINHDVVNINANILHNLIVMDNNEEAISIEQLNSSSISSCFTTTEAVGLDTTRLTIVNNKDRTLAVAVIIPVFLVALIVASLTILLAICVFRNGYCNNFRLFSFQRTNIKKGSDINVDYHMPIYHVLEQANHVVTPIMEAKAVRPLPSEEIPVNEDAPPIPHYNSEGCNASPIPQDNPDHHNFPSIQAVAVTRFSPADNVYAEM